jgi:coenzyme F420-reducing hydrogenase delta subunit
MQEIRPAATAVTVTAFICSNCARPGQAPSSAGLPRPTVPDFHWPVPVREVLVACTGRLQPEHVLKAFESGSDVVCTVGCQEDNCHYLEGSQRCARRVDYLRSILDEIGLGGKRLLFFHLPGTAAQDLALGAGKPQPADGSEARNARVAALREQMLQALDGLAPNPMHSAPVAEAVAQIYQEVDTLDDDNEE